VEVQERSTNLWFSAEYWSFKIGDELNTKYQLEVAWYSGDAGDSLQYEGDINGDGRFGNYYNNRRRFSTFDREETGWSCTSVCHGGWWYNFCYYSCLTCVQDHFAWLSLPGNYLANSRMMIKLQ